MIKRFYYLLLSALFMTAFFVSCHLRQGETKLPILNIKNDTVAVHKPIDWKVIASQVMDTVILQNSFYSYYLFEKEGLLAFTEKINGIEPDIFDLHLHLILFELNNNAIIIHSVLENYYLSDALRFEGLSVDENNFLITANTNHFSFGVRAFFSASSRVNPFSTSELTVFTWMPERQSLIPVLKHYPMALVRGENDGGCNGFLEKDIAHYEVVLKDKQEYYDFLFHHRVLNTLYSCEAEPKEEEHFYSVKMRFMEGHYLLVE